VRWYTRRGYDVVARNWRCSAGEIDLILRQSNTLVFCEVKARASDEFGGPAAAVGWQKQRRLRRLAAIWLTECRPVGYLELRFDVAAVVGTRVDVIEAAF